MKQKIKIMEHKPELSDEEIRSYMNFDNLMASRKQIPQTRDVSWIIKSIVPVVILSGIATWFLVRNPEPVAQFVTTDNAQNEQLPAPRQPEPVVRSVDTKVEKNKSPEGITESATTPERSTETKKVLSTPVNPVEKEDLYIQAEPQEGYTALYNYLNTHLIYPTESIKDSIQGIQTVSFVIDEQGNPGRIQIKQSLGEPFEKEARRLIENMPRWKPASLNGKPVPSQMSIPLTFQLQKIKAK